MSDHGSKSLGTRVIDALDERMGIRSLLSHALDEPIPGGARLRYVFGSALLASIVLQLVTGLLLMTAYAPSSLTAWASVDQLDRRMWMGWLVRGLHHFGSGTTIVLVVAHLVQTVVAGAYKRPRELNWWTGLLLLAVVLGFSLTGYLLPWDQKGYWATRVATNIAGTTPLIGAALQRLLQGGDAYGNYTLTRFYALHVGLLPLTLLALIGAHVALFRKHGVTPPHAASVSKIDAFYPKQVALDAIAAVLIVGATFYLACKAHGAPLDAPADPSSDYPARPEWYFLPLFQLLKWFKGPFEPVGTFVLPGAVALFLVALPLVDRSKTNALGARLPWIAALIVGLAGAGALIVVSKRADARDPAFGKARAVADARASTARRLSEHGVPPEGPLVMMSRSVEVRGAEIFATKCAVCHELAPITNDLKTKGKAASLNGWGTAQWVRSMIDDPDADDRFGRGPLAGQMMSFTHPSKGKEAGFVALAEPKIAAISAFVARASSSPGEGANAALLEEGKKRFDDACSGCHAMNGAGGDDNDYAPSLQGWGSYGWLRAQIARPASGRTYKPAASGKEIKGHMPAFADDAEVSAEIDLVAAYVFERTVGRPVTDAERADARAEDHALSCAPAPSSSASTGK